MLLDIKQTAAFSTAARRWGVYYGILEIPTFFGRNFPGSSAGAGTVRGQALEKELSDKFPISVFVVGTKCLLLFKQHHRT